jgi:DNA-binding HxlR family transcriptional regulator
LDDLVTLIALASSAFFVALAFGLLVKYRQVSQRVNASTDLGRDLWQALEQRLKKQDERILDMLGRFEVIQSRFPQQVPERPVPVAPLSTPNTIPLEERPKSITETPVTPAQQVSQVTLDETEASVIKLLSVKSRSSVEIKELIGKSREHAARLMKALYDSGLVTRDTSKKPFVYQLTETGRRYLSAI